MPMQTICARTDVDLFDRAHSIISANTSLAEQIVCPWGAFSRLEGIVRDMVQHEREHVDEIRRALALSGHAG